VIYYAKNRNLFKDLMKLVNQQAIETNINLKKLSVIFSIKKRQIIKVMLGIAMTLNAPSRIFYPNSSLRGPISEKKCYNLSGFENIPDSLNDKFPFKVYYAAISTLLDSLYMKMSTNTNTHKIDIHENQINFNHLVTKKKIKEEKSADKLTCSLIQYRKSVFRGFPL
jgi:hypothetical protein